MEIAGLPPGQRLDLVAAGPGVHELRRRGTTIATLEDAGAAARETLAEAGRRAWTLRVGVRGAITAAERGGGEVAWTDHPRAGRVRVTLAGGERFEVRRRRGGRRWTLTGPEGEGGALVTARAPGRLGGDRPIRVVKRRLRSPPETAALATLILCRIVLGELQAASA